MSKKIVILRGDGIGPEIADAVTYVLERAGAKFEWESFDVGVRALEKFGDALPPSVVDAIRATGIALKGPITTPIGRGIDEATSFRSVNVRLRKELDLYANVRPIRSMDGVNSRFKNVDLVIIRENTEGLYGGLEHEIVPGVVTSLKVSTRTACLRIAQFAFEYAKKNARKKVTAIHKANIIKLSDGLALECYREVAKEFPEIEYDEKIIDATAMLMVLTPEIFDVLVMENLYGDILSDLGAGLIGGLGLAPSANYGTHAALFEAVHGSAPDIAGKGIANPTALLLSAVEMLFYVGETERGSAIRRAVLETYREGKSLTGDVGGSATTKQFIDAVIEKL